MDSTVLTWSFTSTKGIRFPPSHSSVQPPQNFAPGARGMWGKKAVTAPLLFPPTPHKQMGNEVVEKGDSTSCKAPDSGAEPS